jgi:putative transposase
MFADDADYQFFRDCLRSACSDNECLVHAYVLMHNHVHLLLTPLADASVARVMKALGARYVHHFNKRHDRTGGLWEGRYRASLVETDRYLLTCYRYIELNPVRAGLADHPLAYRWSSYRANAHGARDDLITPHDLFLSLGSDTRARRRGYRQLFEAAIPLETLEDIRRTTNLGWVLGCKRFRNEIATLLGRPTVGARIRHPLRSIDALRI